MSDVSDHEADIHGPAVPPNRIRPNRRQEVRFFAYSWRFEESPDPALNELVLIPMRRREFDVLAIALGEVDPVTPDVALLRALIKDMSDRIRAQDDGMSAEQAVAAHSAAGEVARRDQAWLPSPR